MYKIIVNVQHKTLISIELKKNTNFCFKLHFFRPKFSNWSVQGCVATYIKQLYIKLGLLLGY